MSRLIDADALLEYYKRLSNECFSANNHEYAILYDCVCEKIATQPTAYNVDKVVEELACNSRFIDDINEHNIKCISCVIGQKTAIEIVRKGGV